MDIRRPDLALYPVQDRHLAVEESSKPSKSLFSKAYNVFVSQYFWKIPKGGVRRDIGLSHFGLKFFDFFRFRVQNFKKVKSGCLICFNRVPVHRNFPKFYTWWQCVVGIWEKNLGSQTPVFLPKTPMGVGDDCGPKTPCYLAVWELH